jgi:hypothetical protein
MVACGRHRPRDDIFHKQSVAQRCDHLLDRHPLPLHLLVHHPVEAHVSRRDVQVALHVVPKWDHRGTCPRDATSITCWSVSHSLLNCSSLHSLTLSKCCWPRYCVLAFYSSEWTLPHVMELTLRYMGMTHGNIKDLLMRCPMLLGLFIGYIQCHRKLSVLGKQFLKRL